MILYNVLLRSIKKMINYRIKIFYIPSPNMQYCNLEFMLNAEHLSRGSHFKFQLNLFRIPFPKSSCFFVVTLLQNKIKCFHFPSQVHLSFPFPFSYFILPFYFHSLIVPFLPISFLLLHLSFPFSLSHCVFPSHFLSLIAPFLPISFLLLHLSFPFPFSHCIFPSYFLSTIAPFLSISL